MVLNQRELKTLPYMFLDNFTDTNFTGIILPEVVPEVIV